ncbi:hypothetical protein ATCVMN08101_495R [Acanthocystis turfacea Chlorella virus MN0810.1]|nr:hypothetical protein ATCVMN08101_495R [Acanthocystis turfacea Chlorella virus MN0810.1]
MKTLHLIFLAVFLVFTIWMVKKHRENFTDEAQINFQPGSNGLENDIHGYGWLLGDKRSDSDIYFGFDDSLRSAFAQMLLPKDLQTDLPSYLHQ